MAEEPQAENPPLEWQYLSDIGAAERQFNELQSRYRAIASTWLLAGFAGMGFAATNRDLRLPYEPVVFGIGLATAVGVSLLWVLDEVVVRNLLSAYFLEGLRLEKKNPRLPQVRHAMLRLFQGFSVRRYVGIFYAAAVLIPALTGLFIAFDWLTTSGVSVLKVFFLSILLAIFAVAARIAHHKKNREYVKLLNELRAAGQK